MKNAALITLLVSAMAFSTVAQEREQRISKTAEEIAQMRTDRLAEQLTLTEDQQQAVYALSLENAKKMQAAHKERTAKMAEQRAEMKASQERLNEILTNEQREVLKQQQAERAGKMKSMRGARKNGMFKEGRSKSGKHDFHKKADRGMTTEASPETAK
ncbi:MAG TPA: hypothetical protein VNQ80_16745 [Parapedobacter sp.]|uniref:hypothetical protein n=1 Tax=Parapedobacter sp. TaxID=1958893 RepID=UPI002CACC52C|nr:hypothetical protein [Parapedobacter sp.]HWK58996.1 hypothetical protein [Parapedobacter sp.]